METIRRWLSKTPTTKSTHLWAPTHAHSLLLPCFHGWFSHAAPLTWALHLLHTQGHCTSSSLFSLPLLSSSFCSSQDYAYQYTNCHDNFHLKHLFYFFLTCSITSYSVPPFFMIFLVAKYRGYFCICSLWFLVFHLLLTCSTQALPWLFHIKKWLLLRLTKISMLLNPVVNFWFSFCLAHWQHLTQLLLPSSLITFLNTFLP